MESDYEVWPFRKKLTQYQLFIESEERSFATSSGIHVSKSWSIRCRFPKKIEFVLIDNLSNASTVYQYALEAVRLLLKSDETRTVVVVDSSDGYKSWIKKKPMRDPMLEIPSHAAIVASVSP